MTSIIKVDTIQEKTSGNGVVIANHVIQVIYSEITATQAISSTGWTDITGLSLNITPKVSNSLILITANVRFGNDTSASNGMRLIRDSSTVIGNSTTEALGNVAYNNGGNRPYLDTTVSHFDTPSTTSQVNYKIQAYRSAGTFSFNGRGGEANGEKHCQLIAMEIAQ